MRVIDLHCDTVWRLLELDGEGDLYKNNCSVSIQNLRQSGAAAQFFACFIHLGDIRKETAGEQYEEGYQKALRMIQYLKAQVEAYKGEAALAGSVEELEENTREGKVSAVITIEEGGILNGRLERLDQLYREGVRLLTLMWNYENCIGYPNSTDPHIMGSGLKPFGIEAVKKMNELGMVIDVSHASDGTFWDVLKYSRKPVMASHSNCRAVCGHPRNLSDEMIRALAEKGGIAGLNFYGHFLGSGNDSLLESMAQNVEHMLRTGGSGFPAIGTDFDGFDGAEKMDIPDAGKMGLLWDYLRRRGITESQLDKFFFQNAHRVWKEQ